MRQIWISKTDAPKVLIVKEAPDPRPGAREVRSRFGGYADVVCVPKAQGVPAP